MVGENKKLQVDLIEKVFLEESNTNIDLEFLEEKNKTPKNLKKMNMIFNRKRKK